MQNEINVDFVQLHISSVKIKGSIFTANLIITFCFFINYCFENISNMGPWGQHSRKINLSGNENLMFLTWNFSVTIVRHSMELLININDMLSKGARSTS